MLTPLNRVRCLDDRGAEVGKADRFQSHKIVEMKINRNTAAGRGDFPV